MASEIFAFTVTVPAGTAIATPAKTELAMPPRRILSVQLRVPPGPRGQVGFALAAAGNPMLPSGPGQWFVMDDERVEWSIEDAITSGAWQCLAYNLGLVPHSLYFRFLTALVGEVTALTPLGGLLPNAALSSSPPSGRV